MGKSSQQGKLVFSNSELLAPCYLNIVTYSGMLGKKLAVEWMSET